MIICYSKGFALQCTNKKVAKPEQNSLAFKAQKNKNLFWFCHKLNIKCLESFSEHPLSERSKSGRYKE